MAVSGVGSLVVPDKTLFEKATYTETTLFEKASTTETAPFKKASSTETTLFEKASSTKTSKIFISYICCQSYQNNEHKHGYVPHHSISSTLAAECGYFLEHISNTLAAECGRFLEQDCAIFRAGCLASPVAPPPHQQGCPSCPPSSPVRWTGSSCMS